MRTGELQRFPQGKRETKTVHQAETESHHPATLQAAADNIFERHVNNGNGDKRFDQWRKPEEIRREIVRGGNQRNRMGDGECGYDGNERAKAAEGDHQAKQKQKMVGAVENMEKTQIDKSQGRLVPPRIEADKALIAGEFERANAAAGRQKPKNGDHTQAQARESRVNGKAGLLRLDRILEQNVEHGLVPKDVCVVRERRSGDARIGVFISNEGAVRRKRNARGDDLGSRKTNIIFIDFDEIGDPESCSARRYGSDFREVEVASPALGKINIAHGLERNANQEMEPLALRFNKRLHCDVVRNVVSGRGTWKEQM